MGYCERQFEGGLIEAVWWFEGEATSETRVLPDGRMDIVCRVEDGRCVATIVGTQRGAFRVAAHEVGRYVGARFRPGGLAAALGVRASSLTDRIVEAGALADDSRWRMVEKELARHRASHRQAERLADLAVDLAGGVGLDERAALAMEGAALIESRGGDTRIDDVARTLGVSARTLGRAFEDCVGVSPKVFARVVRMQRAVAMLRSGARGAPVAAACGYADQAHLSRELRRLTSAHA